MARSTPAALPHLGLTLEQLDQLRQRARDLDSDATPGDAATVDGDRGDPVLIFRILDEKYGLPLPVVQEVFFLRHLMAAPGAPPHLAGLTRLRGKIVAVVDLRRFWTPGAVGHADSDLAVLIEHDEVELALLCTDLEELAELPAAELSRPPPHLPPRQQGVVRGVTRAGVMVLDLASLLTQPGFRVGASADGARRGE